MNKPEQKMLEVFRDLVKHNGFGEFKVEVRILKRKQKEVIIHCGRQYRYVMDDNDNFISDEGSR
ncbi:MAG: hypothetical protein GQ532_13405 [Methylomarinum sp.]|nr:hypothetical protein [Methylomarinum sp.]